jgi:hypothetical protein
LTKVDFWPERNDISVVMHYCMDDGCFVDFTMNFWGLLRQWNVFLKTESWLRDFEVVIFDESWFLART